MAILLMPTVFANCVKEKTCYWDYEYTIKERNFVAFVNPYIDEIHLCEQFTKYDYDCKTIDFLPKSMIYNIMYKSCKSWYSWRPYEIVHPVLMRAKEECLEEVDFYKNEQKSKIY